MEQKCMKTPVFTGETIFSDSQEQPIDVDFTLPDYCPDIQKILKCRAVSRISSKGINGRNINIDGYVTITVIYCDNENRLCSYEYQYPFNKVFETGMDCDGSNLLCKTKCEYINCRAVTSRKIDIHGAAGIYVKLKRRKCTEVISDIDDCNIELCRGIAPATSPMGNAEKYLLIEEEIETSQGQPNVRSLIRYDACVAVKDCKLLAGKAMVKGELVLTALYCAEEGPAQTLRTLIPFSQLIEIEGVNEECECEAKAEIAFIELKPRTNASGETRSFQLSAKILVCCEGYCNNDVDVILDAYSRKYEAKIVKNDVSFNKIHKNITETFNCKKNIEFSSGTLSHIADMWCDARAENVKSEDNCFIINGTIFVSIIAFDESGEAFYFEKQLPFDYKYSSQDNLSGLHCDPTVEVVSSNYTITGSGNMELRVDLCLNAAIYKITKIALITEVDVDEKVQINKSLGSALTVYFASKGERVWDIASRYKASVNEIKQINDVETDILEKDCMILVPMV